MNKQEFLSALRKGLVELPPTEAEERLNFYSEMIDDRTEEGLSEEEAVSAVGSVDEIVSQIMADTPSVKVAKEQPKPKKQWKTWEIILLALGSPIWISLGIATVSVILSLYISWWAVIISLWAVFGSLIGCAVGGLVAGIVTVCIGHAFAGTAVIGAAIVCAGLSILMFYGCYAISKATVILTKKTVIGIINRLTKKEVL